MGLAGDIIGAANKQVRIGNSYLGAYGGNYGETGWNSTAGNYIVSDYASRIRFSSGGFLLQTAPSGTAGNAITFTTALSVDSTSVTVASGLSLQVGTTYVATPQVSTGYVILKDATGTSYKFLVAP